MNIPANLISATRSGDIVPLVGSGLSQASGMASWDDILEVLKRHLKDSCGGTGKVDLDAFEVPDAYGGLSASGYRRDLVSIIEEAVGSGYTPNSLHRLLADIPFRTCLTTNWDSLIEDSLKISRRVNVIFDDETARRWRESQASQVIKFHGTVQNPKSIVFGLSDYARLYQRSSVLMSLVRTLISTRPILSLGFGMRDPFLKSLLHAVGHEIGSEHFVVVSDAHIDAVRRNYLEAAGFTLIEAMCSVRDPYGLQRFLKTLWSHTYTEARNRIDRTELLIRETKRLEMYLGHDKTVRARAAMGPLAVPETNECDVFGNSEVYQVEKKLLETIVKVVGTWGGKLRLICCPLDGGAHSKRKGYSMDAHRARLRAFVKWVQNLGSGIELVMADRPSDINDWIVADMSLIESRKSFTEGGRLYEYARLDVNSNSVGAAVRRFDEEFEALSLRKGGMDVSKRTFLKRAREEAGHNPKPARSKGQKVKRRTRIQK